MTSTCPQCSAPFQPARPRQRYCCQKCQVKAANLKRASTREGRRSSTKAGQETLAQSALVQSSRPKAAMASVATVARIFNQYFLRVDGWLAAGPMTEAQAQERVDRMNR